jgi:N-acetylmuramoyl-L-alanine amidase
MRPVTLVLSLFLLLSSAAARSEDRELSTLLDELDATLEWNPLREIGVIVVGTDRVVFKTDFPMAIVDYEERLVVDPPARREGAIYFTESAVAAIRDALFRSRFQKKGEGFRVSTIVIDPGHGGEDPGSVDDVVLKGKKTQIYEKDVVLSIAQNLSSLLTAAYADKKIVMTRSTDTYISLEKRVDIANSLLKKTSDSILYISIHANRTENKADASGFEAWVLPPENKRTLLDEASAGKEYLDILPILNSMMEEDISVWSIILAKDILSELDVKVGALTANRGLKEEAWSVVRNAKMPAVLVEVGFLSNAEEAKRLTDPAYLKDLAEGVYNGIKTFISSLEQPGSVRAR